MVMKTEHFYSVPSVNHLLTDVCFIFSEFVGRHLQRHQKPSYNKDIEVMKSASKRFGHGV